MHDIVVSPSEGAAKKIVEEARAWRVLYLPAGSSTRPGAEIHAIREPKPMLASAESADLAQVLEQPRVADDEGAFTLVWLPGSLASRALEEEVEAWLGGSDECEIVRAGIRTVRVHWTSDRCAIYAPVEQLADAMDAVLRFTPAKRLTNSLERRMLDVWSDLDGDVPLSHSVLPWQLMAQRRINQRTERITRLNAEYLRLQTALEQLDVRLSSASKRLYAELASQATIHDRLEMMEDSIEFAMAHYELANTRLIETRNSWIERWFEGAIVAMLAIEIFVLVARHG